MTVRVGNVIGEGPEPDREHRPHQFKGLTTMSVGSTPVQAAHFLRLRTDSGAQRGTERSEVWFSTSTGLPLRVQQDIKVTSPTPSAPPRTRKSGSSSSSRWCHTVELPIPRRRRAKTVHNLGQP